MTKLMKNLLFSCAALLLVLSHNDNGAALAFAPTAAGMATTGKVAASATTTTLAATMMDPNSFSDAVTMAYASSGMILAETEAWVQPAAAILDPFLNLMSFAMLCRVVLSWYPDTNIAEMPWLLVTFPTQGLLKLVKGVVPPAFGVDITPIFWLAIFTFIHEILLGQQGLFTLKLKYGI